MTKRILIVEDQEDLRVCATSAPDRAIRLPRPAMDSMEWPKPSPNATI
jgi:hypothetical protein